MNETRVATFNKEDKKLSCTLILKPEEMVKPEGSMLSDNTWRNFTNQVTNKFAGELTSQAGPIFMRQNEDIIKASALSNARHVSRIVNLKMQIGSENRACKRNAREAFEENENEYIGGPEEKQPIKDNKKITIKVGGNEDERILKRLQRFSNIEDESKSLATTININGTTIVTRNGYVESRKYSKAEYSKRDEGGFDPTVTDGFVVEKEGFRSIPMNFFNNPQTGECMGPAGVIISYMISKGMMKEPPWKNRAEEVFHPHDDNRYYHFKRRRN